MRLALLTIAAIVVLGSTPAIADDIVILPPLGSDARAVSSALSSGKKVGSLAALKVDATCAGDPGCLAKTGADLSANRIVAITANSGGKLDIIVVDVGAKLLLGTRTLTFSPKKLKKELPPALAKAIDEMTVDKAKALFAEGNESYNLGEFDKALERYKLAYRVKPLPAFQFNIAQCHRKLGQHQEAIAMYQAYLIGVPKASNKDMVDGLIAESKKAIEDQKNATAKLEHDKLEAEKAKADAERKAKEAQANASSAESERAKAEQARIAAERDREKTYNRHPARKWMFVTGLLGAATVGVGAYFGIQERDAQERFDTNQCGDRSVPRLQPIIDQCNADKDLAVRDALLTNVLIGSGGAVVLISAIVYAIDPGNIDRPTEKRVGVALTPTGVKVVFKW